MLMGLVEEISEEIMVEMVAEMAMTFKTVEVLVVGSINQINGSVITVRNRVTLYVHVGCFMANLNKIPNLRILQTRKATMCLHLLTNPYLSLLMSLPALLSTRPHRNLLILF